MPELGQSSLIAHALPLRRDALEGHVDEEAQVFSLRGVFRMRNTWQ